LQTKQNTPKDHGV